MSQPKQASKQKRRACAVPLLGAAGLTLSLTSGASGVTPNTEVTHEIMLGEEEISDVSLATFYVFDKENPRIPGLQLAGQGGGGGGEAAPVQAVAEAVVAEAVPMPTAEAVAAEAVVAEAAPVPTAEAVAAEAVPMPMAEAVPMVAAEVAAEAALRRLRRGLVGWLRRLRRWGLLVLAARLRLDLVLLNIAKVSTVLA